VSLHLAEPWINPKANHKGDKFLLMKSVGIVDVGPDAVFEMVLRSHRDMNGIY
jgi:hypothetical protein